VGKRFHGWLEPPCGSLALSGNPLRFNLHASFDARGIVTKAAPLPVFRTFTQCTLHRVAMDVSQFFHELRMIPNIEIVIALLPEVLGFADQPPRDSLLQGLDGIARDRGVFSPLKPEEGLNGAPSGSLISR